MMKWCLETSANHDPAFMGHSLVGKTETIVCNFIGDFKVGDNMLANADSLCRLAETNDFFARGGM